MARKIDHAQRRREIAQKATRLFSQVGYDNVSLIMIAQASGVSRTVIYRYFCSKREVLDEAIQEILEIIRTDCRAILATDMPNLVKLERSCHAVADAMYAHKDFLVAIFDFVIAMTRAGSVMNTRVAEYTQPTRRLIELLLDHARREGEMAPTIDTAVVADNIYAAFESCAMRIVLGTENDSSAARSRFSTMFHALAVPDISNRG